MADNRLDVHVVTPEREVWSGDADMVVAESVEGQLGILAEGSLVRILDPEAGEEAAAGEDVLAAVSSGFLAVADDRVSILSRQAQLASTVDTDAVQAELNAALEDAGPVTPDEEPTEVKYARALLRAADERS